VTTSPGAVKSVAGRRCLPTSRQPWLSRSPRGARRRFDQNV